jgi:hypothetical protein
LGDLVVLVTITTGIWVVDSVGFVSFSAAMPWMMQPKQLKIKKKRIPSQNNSVESRPKTKCDDKLTDFEPFIYQRWPQWTELSGQHPASFYFRVKVTEAILNE